MISYAISHGGEKIPTDFELICALFGWLVSFSKKSDLLGCYLCSKLLQFSQISLDTASEGIFRGPPLANCPEQMWSWNTK